MCFRLFHRAGRRRRRRNAGAAPKKKVDDPAELLERGRQVYNFRCYFCHGYSGRARTVAAQQLNPPPRDFTTADQLTREDILRTLRDGIPGTAMKSFTAFLDRAEQEAVAEYILESFVRKKAVKPGYHTAENGWPDHERKYGAAFPFVLGEIGIDRPVETLSAAERTGRDLFISACVTCHEPRSSAPLRIEPFPLSHMGRVVREAPVDAISSASVYAKHDVPPVIPDLTPAQARGQRLFEDNCAFCHGADGTGRNWIGSFLEPHPRDLTDPAQTAHLDRMALRRVIREGLPDTSMPAWRHVLTAAEIADIAAYVERAFLRPATGN